MQNRCNAEHCKRPVYTNTNQTEPQTFNLNERLLMDHFRHKYSHAVNATDFFKNRCSEENWANSELWSHTQSCDIKLQSQTNCFVKRQ